MAPITPPRPGNVPPIATSTAPEAHKPPAISPLDLPDANGAWFSLPYRGLTWEKNQPPSPAVDHRLVTYIHVQDYYVALGKAVRGTRDSQADFVYITGWELDLDTFVDPPGTGSRQTLRDLLTAAAQRKVEILALLDDTQNSSANRKTASDIGKLGGGAYVDDYHQLTGSHHQKMVVIRNAEGVMAFCGGMDIANHRLGRDGATGKETPEALAANPELTSAPWHDVQVRVEGGAAADLWQDFVLRWREVTASPVYGSGPTNVREPVLEDARRHAGSLDVQVVRTFPNMSRKHFTGLNLRSGYNFGSILKSGYNFAPNGEMQYYLLLVNALSRTTKTIYLEDQYLVNSADMSAFTAITAAIRKAIERDTFQKMIIIVAGNETVQGELFQAGSRRSEFIQQLGPTAAARVATYKYKGDPNSPYWFHSKLWIFDDKFAVVGSANCNRRGYSCDSEIGVGVVDRTYAAEGRLNFAQRLRMDLWLKHLNAVPKTGGSNPYGVLKDDDVRDFTKAAALWDKASLLQRVDFTDHPPADLRLSEKFVKEYPGLAAAIPSAAARINSLLSRDDEWSLIDPDGS